MDARTLNRLEGCAVTEEICSYLVPALTSHTSTLNGRHLEERDGEHLCSTLGHQNSRLQKIQLHGCPLTEKSCSDLVSFLTSRSSHFTQLQMDVSIEGDSSAEKLIALQNDPHYHMDMTCENNEPSKGWLHLSRTVLEDSEGMTPCGHIQQQTQDHGRICQTCAHVQDPGHWCVLQPSILLENGEHVYTMRSAGGSYECLESGLRWTCAGPVILQYRISEEELFLDQLQMLLYRPAGPLLDIKLLSGELEEVYLPHSLCLGGSDPSVLGDAVRALHGEESGVALEKCELSRFHGRLSTQHLSLWQLVVWLGFPVKSHCEVLIYEHCPRPLVLHTFMLPSPSSARQAVKERWGGRGIVKPSPEHSLWIGSTVQLHTSPDSLEIIPKEVTITYRNPPTFFEVCLKNPLQDFKMEIKTAENHTVWEAMMREGADYHWTQDHPDTLHSGESHTDEPPQPSGMPGKVGSLMAAAFLEERRPELIQRVTEVMPIADQLLSQSLLGQETYAKIQAAASTQDKMRSLCHCLGSAGPRGKLAFYRILQAQEPHLVEELWTAK